MAIAAPTSFLKTAAEGVGAPKNFETKALKKELAISKRHFGKIERDAEGIVARASEAEAGK